MRRRFTRERTNDQAHTLAWRDGRPRLVICRMSAFCLPSQMPVWRPERQVSLAPSHRRSAMAEELFERSPPASGALDCAHCCQEAKLMSIRWIPLLSAQCLPHRRLAAPPAPVLNRLTACRHASMPNSKRRPPPGQPRRRARQPSDTDAELDRGRRKPAWRYLRADRRGQQAMMRAGNADRAGDQRACNCKRALAEVQSAIGP